MALRALKAVDLVRSHGLRRVLDGVSLKASPGDRIGLIGENGVGKTTLLRLLAGVDGPESGSIERPDDVGFLQQELPYEPSAAVQDVVDDALQDSRDTLRRLDQLSARLADDSAAPGSLAAYGEILERAQDRDAWDADRRAEVVLDGLGLGALPRHRRLSEISGGQRGRLALAALLIQRPTALLLDEPTNHLDDAAAGFLEKQLRDMPGIVVLATHDRALLDEVCTDLLDLDPSMTGPVRFGGNYSAYRRVRQDERERWERQFVHEQVELSELRQAVSVTSRQVAHGRAPRDSEKMGYGHTAGRVQQQVSRRVRDASRRLDELARDQVRKPPSPLHFHVPAVVVAGPEGTVASLRDIDIPGRVALDRLDIAAADHVLITGPNGAGKSTLLQVLIGTLPTDGQVLRRPGLRIGYLAQDSIFERPELTAQQTFTELVGNERSAAVPLRSFGLIAPRDAGTPVGVLSLGQRRRLALAVVLADPPELLVLDEPTNHLSPLVADELQDAMDAASGAIVIASHDRWLRRRWRGTQLELIPTSTTV